MLVDLRKYSMYSVTPHDVPESIIAYETSFVQALLDMSIAILSNLLFCSLDLFCRGNSSWSSGAISC
jgi:hypothetical protein